MQWGCEVGAVYLRQTNICLPILYVTGRQTNKGNTLFATKQTHLLPTTNNNLFANLFLFMSGEGDEATSPSFTTRYAAIEASSASLEALIASLLPACGPAKEATFPTAIRLLIAVGSLVACARWRVGNDAILHVDGRLQRVVASTHSSLDARDAYS